MPSLTPHLYREGAPPIKHLRHPVRIVRKHKWNYLFRPTPDLCNHSCGKPILRTRSAQRGSERRRKSKTGSTLRPTNAAIITSVGCSSKDLWSAKWIRFPYAHSRPTFVSPSSRTISESPSATAARIERPSDDQDTRRAMNVGRSPKSVI